MFKEELLLIELLTPKHKTAGITDSLPSPSEIISKIKSLFSGPGEQITAIVESSRDPESTSHLIGEIITGGAVQMAVAAVLGGPLSWIATILASVFNIDLYGYFLKIWDMIKGNVSTNTLTEEHIEKATDAVLNTKSAFNSNLRDIKLYKTAGVPMKIMSVIAHILKFIFKILFKGCIVVGAGKAVEKGKEAVFGPSAESVEKKVETTFQPTGNNERIGGKILDINNTLDNIKLMLVELTNDTYKNVPEQILRSSYLFNRVAKDIYNANSSYGDDNVSVIIPSTYPDQKSLVNIFMPEVVDLMKKANKT
jgi:hypothetical protein